MADNSVVSLFEGKIDEVFKNNKNFCILLKTALLLGEIKGCSVSQRCGNCKINESCEKIIRSEEFLENFLSNLSPKQTVD